MTTEVRMLREDQLTAELDRLAGSFADGKGAALVGDAVASVDTIDDLRNVDSSELEGNRAVNVLGYHAPGDGGGGLFRADLADSSTADDGGLVIVAADGTRWHRVDRADLAPEHWGAVGDGAADDTAAVRAWWESGLARRVARGRYRVDFAAQAEAAVTAAAPEFHADLRGAEFVAHGVRNGLFLVDCQHATAEVSVIGGVLDADGQVPRAIQVIGSAARRIVIEGLTALNVAESTQNMSAVPIRVTVPAELVIVRGCTVVDVQRVTVNPGVVACQAISVTGIDGAVTISDNVIRGVLAPAGEVDADGIVVFSSNRLADPVERQRVRVDVERNIVAECSGRYVKAQTTGLRVRGNRFEALAESLITSFRAVDLQYAGGVIVDNVWELGDVAGGAVAVFANINTRPTGNWESIASVRSNQVILSRDLRYLAFITVDAGQSVVRVVDNDVTRHAPTATLDRLVRWEVTPIADVDRAHLDISGNRAPVQNGQPLILTPAAWGSDADYAARASLKLVDNECYGATSASGLLIATAGSVAPYLRHVVIRGNQGASQSIVAQGMDLDALPPGCAFRFSTDGGAGGLLNAPSGYNRFVRVWSDGELQRIHDLANARSVERGASGAWVEYSGTAL